MNINPGVGGQTFELFGDRHVFYSILAITLRPSLRRAENYGDLTPSVSTSKALLYKTIGSWKVVIMYIRSFLVMMTMFAFLTQPFGAFAQNRGDWSSVRSLGSGSEVRVETKAGKKHDGTISSVTDSGISVLSKGQTVDVALADVKKVHSVGNGSRGKGVAIGGAIGAGVGAAIGGGLLAATGGSDDTGGVLAPFIAVGAGIGALAGAFLRGKKRTLIYEAR